MDNPFFKEGDQLAYVVWYEDDNEPYEDIYQCIDAIFSSWDKAERYLNSLGVIKKERDWRWVYSAGISVKVKEHCWEYEYTKNGYDPTYTIEIWNLSTGKRVYWDDEHICLVEEK